MSDGWQNSRSTDRRHEHTLVRDSSGRDVCSVCRKVVIVPIKSADDPRLDGAGLRRSGEDISDAMADDILCIHSLPELLIALYHEGPEFGYAKAPVAPYVQQIIDMYNTDAEEYDIWAILAQNFD